MAKKRRNNIIFIFFIFIIFIFLSLLWTYPLILRLDSSIFGDGNWLFDTLVAIYGTWVNKMTWLGVLPQDFNNLIGYPFGIDTSLENREPVLEIPLLFLSLWKNELFAFNIIILSSFILSGITMYYLAFYFTKDRISSFLSAIIYAFCPYHSLQSFSHMSLAVIQWMPLYVLSLLKFGEKVSYTRGILCAVFFLLVALSNYYYAYIMFIFTLIFFLVNLYKWYKLNIRYVFNFIWKFLLMGLIIIIVLIPLNYKAVKAVWKGRNNIAETEVPRHARPLDDLFRYSARITDYVRPSEYHPIFGKMDFMFIKPYKESSRHWAERTVFLGYIPLIFSFYFIFKWNKRKKKIFDQINIYILLFSTIIAFIISLPPKLGFISMPSLFLYRLFPMFRSYARFGILVILGVAIFSGLGIREVLAGYRRRILYTSIISGLILFEFTVFPPFRNVDFSKIPPVYEWIAKIPNEIGIAEYPIFSEIDSDHYKYLFYQRLHRHPLFNGSRIGSLGDAIGRHINDISKIESTRILGYLGIQYIILHKDKYTKKELREIDNNKGLAKVIDFKDSIVYKVIAIPDSVEMVFWRNFYNWEKWDDGNYWRWADNDSTICLLNTDNEPLKILIRFKAISFAKTREILVYLDKDLVYRDTIPSPSKLYEAKEIRLSILLKPGSNILRFYCPEGSDVIDNILHNNDKRKVCFGFSNIELLE